MPTGPKGEKRPADVIGNAVKVMRIATVRSSGGLRRGRYPRPGITSKASCLASRPRCPCSGAKVSGISSTSFRRQA